MNILFTIAIVVFATATNARRPRNHYSSSAVSSVPSSSSSSSVDACREAVASIATQPNVPAINYFKRLQCALEAQTYYLFNDATQVQYANAFAVQNNVNLYLINPLGYGTLYPLTDLSDMNTIPSHNFSGFRNFALNIPTFSRSDLTSVYAFSLFNQVGQYMQVQIVANNTQLPLNTFVFKPTRIGC